MINNFLLKTLSYILRAKVIFERKINNGPWYRFVDMKTFSFEKVFISQKRNKIIKVIYVKNLCDSIT